MGRWTEIRLATLVVVAGILATACGNESAPTEPAPVYPTAASLGEQDVRAIDDYLAEPPYSEADPAKGERIAATCRACHTLEAGGANRLGPNLHGFFGREAGTGEDYRYSPVLAESTFVWTPRALEAWLAAPGKFLPGNRMTFAGVRDASDRADLVAYLLRETGSQ